MLIVLFVIVLFFIIFTYQNSDIVVEKNIAKEEYNEKRQKEKENWLNSPESNIVTYSGNERADEIDGLVQEYIESELESQDQQNQMDQVMKRYYEKEYLSLKTLVQENSDKMSQPELYEQSYVHEFFYLVIDVVKNKPITQQEKNVLIDFLKEQQNKVKEGSDIQKAIEDITKVK